MIGLDAGRKDDAPVVFDKASRKRAGNVSEAAGGPAPWKQNIRGPTAVFSTRARKARNWVDEARQANSAPAGRSRPSAPPRSSMPVSSRTLRWRASMATG